MGASLFEVGANSSLGASLNKYSSYLLWCLFHLVPILVFQETMIRGNTLITLAVVLGLAYVFGKEADTEKHQEGDSLLPDIESDVVDAPEDERKEETVNDPKGRYRYRKRKRYRYRRSRYRRNKPSQTPKPTPNPPTPDSTPCSTSRPPTDGEWANDWQGHMFFECPRGKTKLLRCNIGPMLNRFSCLCNS